MRMKTPPSQYADTVVEILSGEFADLAADPAVARVLHRKIAEYVAGPAAGFEWIVDWPSVANWRLKPDQERPGRLRLACYKQTPSDTDRALEEKVNARLATL
ncbi:hypothetical protein [Actinomadura sp. 3N407]|uniref:hypothetical protein n=1 Tax=Actinomadura sp. 3N407 TaxID=3457423 RepID=UPI003FCD547B